MNYNNTTFKARARFNDPKGALLEILARRMKSGEFQVFAAHTPKAGKRQRGCVGLFATQAEAEERFTQLVTEATRNRWQRRTRKSAASSSFDTLPKAAA